MNTNPNLPELDCDVCGKPALGVAGSSMGALSLAYCRECLEAHREPYWIVVAGLVGAGSTPDDWAEWVRPIINASLAFAGKTLAELAADVKAADDEYCAAMGMPEDAP